MRGKANTRLWQQRINGRAAEIGVWRSCLPADAQRFVGFIRQHTAWFNAVLALKGFERLLCHRAKGARPGGLLPGGHKAKRDQSVLKPLNDLSPTAAFDALVDFQES